MKLVLVFVILTALVLQTRATQVNDNAFKCYQCSESRQSDAQEGGSGLKIGRCKNSEDLGSVEDCNGFATGCATLVFDNYHDKKDRCNNLPTLVKDSIENNRHNNFTVRGCWHKGYNDGYIGDCAQLSYCPSASYPCNSANGLNGRQLSAIFFSSLFSIIFIMSM